MLESLKATEQSTIGFTKGRTGTFFIPAWQQLLIYISTECVFCFKLNVKHGVPLKAGYMGTMLLVMKESGSVPVGLKSEEER